MVGSDTAKSYCYCYSNIVTVQETELINYVRFLTFRYKGKDTHIWKVPRVGIIFTNSKMFPSENPTTKNETCSKPQLIQVKTEKGEFYKIIGTATAVDETSLPHITVILR